MKRISAETNLMKTHGYGALKLGKEVCLCGRPAIKFKLSAWCCERCNRIEENQYRDAERNRQLKAARLEKQKKEENENHD